MGVQNLTPGLGKGVGVGAMEIHGGRRGMEIVLEFPYQKTFI